MPVPANFSKRRVFVRLKDNAQAFQIFSIAQESDGSIYISSPNFAQSKWLHFPSQPNLQNITAISPSGDGKLSIHASGFARVRAHEHVGHKFSFQGNHLINTESRTHSVRHLVTVFISEPSHIPEASPAGNRSSDHILDARWLKPITFIFFAVPRSTGITGVKLQWSFHVDVIGEPPEISWGEIPLKTHSLVWVAYTTKLMTEWPTSYHYCHHDGFLVPFFMGGGPISWKFCMVSPVYEIATTGELVINIDASKFDGGES